jgi:hypothetical protein
MILCYKLMATFHKMKDEPGTEIIRCFGRGHAGHVSKHGQPDQRPADSVGAIRRRRAAAGLDPGNSQRVDLSCSGAPGHLPLGARFCGAVLGNAARGGCGVRADGAAADHSPSKWQDLAPGACRAVMMVSAGRFRPGGACRAGGRAARPCGHPPQAG